MNLNTLLPDVVISKLDAVINWSRKNSLWPMPFGTACCAIEFMSAANPRYDMARFGAEVLRFSPRQADLMMVAGRISLKMMPVLLRIWDQMSEPKWCISMGACASNGGMFNTYPQIQGIDQYIPVDVYIPGCPPRPETVLDALMAIQDKVDTETIGVDYARRALGSIHSWTPRTAGEARALIDARMHPEMPDVAIAVSAPDEALAPSAAAAPASAFEYRPVGTPLGG